MRSITLVLCFWLLATTTAMGYTLERRSMDVVRGEVEIHLSYPQIQGLGNPAMEDEFNRIIRERVRLDTIEQEIADEIQYWDLDYDVYSTDRVISIHFTGSNYYYMAAHPNDYIEDINFDLRTGRVFTLGDVFRSGYLEVLNPLVAESLYMGPCGEYDLMLEGVSSEQPFYLDDAMLHVDFQKYEVGPGVCGSLTADIHWQDMEAFIDPKGPLGK